MKEIIKGLEVTPIQANRVRALLHALMNYAIREELRETNPVALTDRYPENVRNPVLTPEELARFHAMLDRHPGDHTDAIKLMLWTGARRNEALLATWDEFDLAKGTWKRAKERNKGKRESLDGLNAPTAALMRSIKARKQPVSEADLIFNARGFRYTWARLIKAAGLDTKPGGFRVHDLRHVFARSMREAEVPVHDIVEMLHQNQLSITLRYTGKRELEARRRHSNLGVAALVPTELTSQ